MRSSLVLSAALSAVALVGSTALAAPDHKTYPGALAHANNASISYSNGRALNTTTTATNTFVLPIVRDQSPTVGISSARIWVIDQAPQAGPAANVSCSVFTRFSASGNQHDVETRVDAGGLEPDPQPLNFGAFAAPSSGTIVGADGDYYFATCTLPGAAAPAVGQSGVVSYEVNEGL